MRSTAGGELASHLKLSHGGNDFCPKAKPAAPEAMREHCRGFGGTRSPEAGRCGAGD